MSNDLISRSAVNKAIKKYMKEYKDSPARLAACKAIMCMVGDEKQIPTAYDLESVMGKLGEISISAFMTYANTGYQQFDCLYNIIKSHIDPAIEIVKAGGVKE